MMLIGTTVVLEVRDVVMSAAVLQTGEVGDFLSNLLRQHSWTQRGVFSNPPIMAPEIDDDGFVSGFSLQQRRFYSTSVITSQEQFDDRPHRAVFNLVPLETPANGLYHDQLVTMKIYDCG